MGAAVFGRDGELGAVERFLDGVPSGPSALVLEGTAGIGKTTLWQAATQRAAARGYATLSCRASESETRLSLAALADLLAEVAEESLGRLPAPQRQALEVALLRRDAHGGPQRPAGAGGPCAAAGRRRRPAMARPAIRPHAGLRRAAAWDRTRGDPGHQPAR
jgi:hypothetical protein